MYSIYEQKHWIKFVSIQHEATCDEVMKVLKGVQKPKKHYYLYSRIFVFDVFLSFFYEWNILLFLIMGNFEQHL